MKVVGRRFRDLVRPDGAHDLSLLERAGVVVVDHLEDLARRGQELGAKLLVGGGRRALSPLALLRHLLQALREAAVDRRLPARVRSYASTRRQRRVDDVEATSDK